MVRTDDHQLTRAALGHGPRDGGGRVLGQLPAEMTGTLVGRDLLPSEVVSIAEVLAQREGRRDRYPGSHVADTSRWGNPTGREGVPPTAWFHRTCWDRGASVGYDHASPTQRRPRVLRFLARPPGNREPDGATVIPAAPASTPGERVRLMSQEEDLECALAAGSC